MVLALYASVFSVLIADGPGFQRPGLAGDGRDNLMIVLSAPEFGSLRVCGTIQHERVHWAGDVVFSFGVLGYARGDGAVDPGGHVLDGNVLMGGGQLAQRSGKAGYLDSRCLFSGLLGFLSGWSRAFCDFGCSRFRS